MTGSVRRRVGGGGVAASSRIAASGGTRVARRAGARLESMVTPVPTTNATMMVRGLSTSPSCGSSAPKALNSALIPCAVSDPEEDARATEAMSPTISASSITERSTWRARGSHGAEQRKLPGPLGDRDRERVEDDERADEHRDSGEHEQQRVEEAEAVLDRVGILLGLLLAGLHLDGVRHHPIDARRPAPAASRRAPRPPGSSPPSRAGLRDAAPPATSRPRRWRRRATRRRRTWRDPRS